LNNALLEEVSSQHESKMMKKLEQMEGGPKSMDHHNLPAFQSEQEHMSVDKHYHEADTSL
jgi:hypothetical protein